MKESNSESRRVVLVMKTGLYGVSLEIQWIKDERAEGGTREGMTVPCTARTK